MDPPLPDPIFHVTLGIVARIASLLANTMQIFARRAIVFAMIGSGTRKLMCESCLSGCRLGCNAPITIRQSSASSTCNQQKVRLFYFFESVCKGVFSFFVSFCWDNCRWLLNHWRWLLIINDFEDDLGLDASDSNCFPFFEHKSPSGHLALQV